METDIFNRIEELKETAKDYEHQVELSVLDSCPFIVEVGHLTIGTDSTGLILTQNVPYPMQFTKKAVDEIFGVKFWNGLNETVIPKVYGRSEWYRERLKSINETIELLETHLSETI